MARIVVVLPAPLAPSSTTTSASSTYRSTPRSTWIGPYAASRPRTSSIRVTGSRSRRGAPEIRLDDSLIVLHLGGRALGDLATEVEHDDPVGDPHHQLH